MCAKSELNKRESEQGQGGQGGVGCRGDGEAGAVSGLAGGCRRPGACAAHASFRGTTFSQVNTCKGRWQQRVAPPSIRGQDSRHNGALKDTRVSWVAHLRLVRAAKVAVRRGVDVTAERETTAAAGLQSQGSGRAQGGRAQQRSGTCTRCGTGRRMKAPCGRTGRRRASGPGPCRSCRGGSQRWPSPVST